MTVRRAYPVFVYLKGVCVCQDYVVARDLAHAHQLAAYVARTLARDAVPPAEFDAGRVTWDVLPDPVSEFDTVA